MKIIKLKKDSRGRTPCGEVYHDHEKEYYDERIDKNLAYNQRELGLEITHPCLLGPLEDLRIIELWDKKGNLEERNPKIKELQTSVYEDHKESFEQHDEKGNSKW